MTEDAEADDYRCLKLRAENAEAESGQMKLIAEDAEAHTWNGWSW